MVSNESIIDFLLEQTVVIEESPPEAVSLLNLIAHGTHLSIGSYPGKFIRPENFAATVAPRPRFT
jgi:hypothetical protein